MRVTRDKDEIQKLQESFSQSLSRPLLRDESKPLSTLDYVQEFVDAKGKTRFVTGVMVIDHVVLQPPPDSRRRIKDWLTNDLWHYEGREYKLAVADMAVKESGRGKDKLSAPVRQP